jgi:hypothetical protein
MRKLLLATALLLAPCSLRAQNVAAPIFSGSGAPTGACTPAGTYYDTQSGLIWTCNAANTWQLPTKIVLTSSYSVSSNVMTNIPGLLFPVGANQNYGLICSLFYNVSSTSTIPQIRFTGPASPTAVNYTSLWQVAPTSSPDFSGTPATAFSTTQGSSPTVTTNLNLLLHLGLLNGSTAGTVQLQGAASVTGTFTVLPGSWCAIQ